MHLQILACHHTTPHSRLDLIYHILVDIIVVIRSSQPFHFDHQLYHRVIIKINIQRLDTELRGRHILFVAIVYTLIIPVGTICQLFDPDSGWTFCLAIFHRFSLT
jgi:hypothetical protein